MDSAETDSVEADSVESEEAEKEKEDGFCGRGMRQTNGGAKQKWGSGRWQYAVSA